MEWVINNWFLFVAGAAAVGVAAIAIKHWLELPTEEQIRNIKQWLLYAVTEAEAQLGSGTGQIKLRYVYDKAIERFKWAGIIKFETFSDWVDEALEEMKHMLATNQQIRQIVEEDQ